MLYSTGEEHVTHRSWLSESWGGEGAAYLSSSSLDCSTWRWYSMLWGLLASVDLVGLGAEVLTSREERTLEDMVVEV